MKRLNKKGFTLIELMAVVIVLIIVIFIAVSRINNSTKETKDNTYKATSLNIIKETNNTAGLDVLTSKSLKSGLLSVNSLKDNGVTLTGQLPSDGFICMDNYKVSYACFMYGKKYMVYENDNMSGLIKGDCFDHTFPTCASHEIAKFGYTGNYQVFTAPSSGYYKIEAWGAKGGDAPYGEGGKGAYTSGTIELSKNDKLYIYVGGKGATAYTNGVVVPGGYNGGGYAEGQSYGSRNWGSGGGATDVRYFGTTTPTENDLVWNSELGINSRIMVAAGGGGGYSEGSGSPDTGGAGGALIGINGRQTSSWCYGEGGSQIQGGKITNDCNESGRYSNLVTGSFGAGGDCPDNCSGGGGGYYGGSRSGHVASAGGGSSYISGHAGSIAISSSTSRSIKSGCSGSSTTKECSIHYSNKFFIDTTMIAGTKNMPSYTNVNETMVGNADNGFVRISH